jgi:hypothetical protein
LICFILFVSTTSQASAPTITSAPNFVFQRQENEGPAFLGYQALKDGRCKPPFVNLRFFQSITNDRHLLQITRKHAMVAQHTSLRVAGQPVSPTMQTSIQAVPMALSFWFPRATAHGIFFRSHSDIGWDFNNIPLHSGPSKTCGSGLIYNNPTDATALSYVGCFSNTLRPTYYRQKRTSSTTITITLATTMTSSALSEARAGPISTSTSTSSTASPSPTEKPAPQNLAWVAGPLVGGIAGLAIIALLVWIVLLLRKKQSHAPTPENQFVQPDYTAKPTYQAQIYPSPGPEQAPRVMSMGPSQYPSAPTYELEHVTYHGPRPRA